jgi:hypothetical protein
MNLRHAAALALVGWYLMVLPKGQQTSALNERRKCQRASSQSQCETIRASYTAGGASVIDCTSNVQNPAAPFGIEIGIEFADTQCIATDDPRLKEK